MSAHPRLARSLRLTAKIFGYFVLGVIALVAILLLCINLPPLNGWVAGRVNAALEPSFKGKLVLHRLGFLDFGGITGAEVEVFDPAGQSVVQAHDIDVRLSVLGIAWHAVTDKSDVLHIPIDRISLDSVDMTLIDDGAGSPTLAHAFEPRQPPPVEEEPGGTAIAIEELGIETTRVRGGLAALTPIDVDLGQLRAQLTNDPQGTHVVLQNLALSARQLPQVGVVTGRLTADVTLPAEPVAGATPPTAPSGEPVVADGSNPSKTVYALTPAPVQRIVAAFEGDIAGSGAVANVQLTGQQLAATFAAASLQPSTVTRLVPALAPTAPLSLSAKVDGLLDQLAFEARLAERAAEIHASGNLARSGDNSKLSARVITSKLDLSQLMPEGAKTALNLDANTALEFGAKGGAGTYRLVNTRSEYAGQLLPKTSVDGELKMPTDAPLTTTGRVEITEPGAPTHIDYDVRSGDAGVIAILSSLTKVDKPARLRDLGGGLVMTGEIASRARYDAAHGQVDAEVRLNMTDVRHPQARAARFDVAAMARGPLNAPNLELLVTANGVVAGNRKYSRARVHAIGTSEELTVGAQLYGNRPDKLDLRAVVAPGSERLVRSPVIRVQDNHGNIVIRAAGVSQTGERLRLDGLTIEGPGSATGSLVYGKELEQLTLDAKQLDVARLLGIAGVRSNLTSAKLDVAAEFRGGRQPRGKLLANMSDVGLGKLRGGTAKADFQLTGGKIVGNADIELTRGAKTTIVIEGIRSPLGDGPAPSIESLMGDVKLQGDIDLEKLQPFLPFAGIERASGQIEFDIDITRNPDSKQMPTVRAKLKSNKFVLVSERPDTEQMPTSERAKVTAPMTLRGIDIDMEAELANHTAKLAGRLFDRRGDVLTVDASFRDIGNLSDPARALERAPFTARATLPRRSFEQWPAPIRPAEIQGALTLQIDANGTLLDPHVQARGRVDGFRAASDDPKLSTVDIELGAQYQALGGNILLKAHDKGKVVLGLDSRWSGDVAKVGDAFSTPDGKSPILASMDLSLEDFPVEVVPELHNRHVTGNLSGRAKLDGLGKNASFLLDLHSKRILVDRMILNELEAHVKTTGEALELEAHLSGTDGNAKVEATTGLTWNDRLVPVVDQSRVRGGFTAKQFPLATLQPIVEGTLSELDGKLDANIRAEIEDGQPRLSGNAALTDGVLQLPSVGQRFSDISAKVAITPAAVRIDDVSARGLSGGFKAQAEAQLKGLSPVSAKATLSIKEGEKLPLTVEGESMGDAWGSIDVNYRVDEPAKRNLIEVNLKKFHIELPAAPAQGIQDLAQAEHIRVGYWRQDRDFVTIPLQPLETPSAPSEYTTVVTVDLGELWVDKGDQVEVGVGGRIQATLGEELDVTGKIETKRGSLDISGKKFDIERGTVTFTGGPPDTPIISAVARYDSPAGYTVYAEYTGTATEGKLGLRSEPPLSQDEILTLLMFGTPDGSFGAGGEGGNDLSTAVSVAGGTAAQGLNRALSKVTNLDVSARVDTSTGAPRPELVLQITPRVAARVTQALGEPSPGQSPDRTFVTIELRMASAWALSTMVGDRGASAFDVIWRRRY